MGAGELLERPAAVRGQVEWAGFPTPAVVEEASGQIEKEVAAQGGLETFQAQVVVEDGFANGVGIRSFGRDAFDLGAERGATVAAGAIRGGGDGEQEDGLEGQGADGAGECLLAGAQGAAVGARSVLGGVVAVLVTGRRSERNQACLRGGEESWSKPPLWGRQNLVARKNLVRLRKAGPVGMGEECRIFCENN